MAAPMQGLTEISLGILLLIGLFTRPAAFVAFLVPRQPLGLGVRHLMDLGAAGSRARVARARHRTRGPDLGRRRMAGAALAERSVVVGLSTI